jgi:hypothetical protein
MPRKCLGASIDAAACTNSDCTKNGVHADNAIKRDDPEERVDPAGQNEIMEYIHVAETTVRSGKMQTQSSGKDYHGFGEQLSGCGQESSGELISRWRLAGKRLTFIGCEGSCRDVIL